MKTAIKYIYDANPFYVYLKKHYCPKCEERMKTKYISKIINSKSPEARKYDFSVGDTFFIGDVEFRIMCFVCPECLIEVSFKEMKIYERNTIKQKKSCISKK